MPASPSTRILSPLAIRRVATAVPSTAGMPYSRATIELWLSGPPGLLNLVRKSLAMISGRSCPNDGSRRSGPSHAEHPAT